LKRRISITPAAAVVSVIAVIAMLGGTAYATSRINGRTIKVHSIPGNRLARNAEAPNSAKLGGHPATAFAAASTVSATGYVVLPENGVSHTLLVRPPLTWVANCTNSDGNPDIEIAVKATSAATFSAQSDEDFGHQIAKGDTYPLDVFSAATPVNSTLTYSVVGADHIAYAGAFTIDLGMYGQPCGVSVYAVG